jgi:hypothetical protein
MTQFRSHQQQEEKIPMNKRSIGKLRPANRTKEKSPNLTGKLALQRATLNELAIQIREDGGSEITCNVAGWFNVDSGGKYITVEISPLFRREPRPTRIEDFLVESSDD